MPKLASLLTSVAPTLHLPDSPCLPPSHSVLLTPALTLGVSVLPYSISFTIVGSMTLQLEKKVLF